MSSINDYTAADMGHGLPQVEPLSRCKDTQE